MRFFVLTALFLCLSTNNSWAFEADKIKHFYAGAVFYAALAVPGNEPALGLLAASAAGVGKELYDSRQAGNRFDGQDLLATVVGGIAALAIHQATLLIVDHFDRSRHEDQSSAQPSGRSGAPLMLRFSF